VTYERCIHINAKLYQVRDAARRALGDKYRAKMAEGGELLSGVAQARGCGVLEVALNVSQAAHRAGDLDSIPFILAAAVELLEPSEDAA